MSDQIKIKLEENCVLFTQDEIANDLFLVKSGKLMACYTKGTQVTPIAYLEENEYIGEMSFFDHKPRSAHIISVKPTVVVRIPVDEIRSQMPPWLIKVAQSMIKNIRFNDTLIGEKGFRKRKNTESIEPLSIDDQRKYLQIINNYRKRNEL